jgi:hypothetical protein
VARDVTQTLAEWLGGGGSCIGQIVIGAVSDGFELRHRDDLERPDLQTWRRVEDARILANHDDAGVYRPLKSAPNLAHGWRLIVPDAESLRRALDYFYPAMLGVRLSDRRRELPVRPLRATLERQTGMYRVTRKITDPQGDALIGRFCEPKRGCLKKILWQIAPGVPITTLPPEKFPSSESAQEWPLLCQEACNLLIAEARKIVKP